MNSPVSSLINRIPRFMRLEVERIQTLEDLQFQVSNEISLAEDGDIPAWTRDQMKRAKAFSAKITAYEESNANRF